jgi:hypothetical protein
VYRLTRQQYLSGGSEAASLPSPTTGSDGPRDRFRFLESGSVMTLLACFLAAACSGAASVSGPDEPEHGSSSVSSVQMTPSNVALPVNSSAELSVKVESADGTSLDRAGTWSVEDPDMVELEGEGTERRVTVRSVGRTRVITTVEGVSDTSVVEGTEGGSAQGSAGSTVVFDPDRYSSTQELMDDPYGVFGGAELGEDGEKGQISLDTDVAPPGGSQSMRYDYIDQGVGNSLHVGRRMPLASKATEVWIELQARWSENFFAIRDFPQDGSTFAHKFLFGEVKALATDPNWETSEGWSVNRWALHVPGGGSDSPPNGPLKIQTPRHEDGTSIVDGTGFDVPQLFDERWHTIRIHWRHDPGRFWLEIDGVVVTDVSGFTIHPEVRMTAILLGRNKDDGIESGTESLWWGKVSVWTEDPGW